MVYPYNIDTKTDVIKAWSAIKKDAPHIWLGGKKEFIK